jgi:hypothetical protein
MAGILTWKGYFRRCWCPSLSTYPPQCLPRGRHDTYVSQAAKNVQKSQDTLIDIFQHVEGFFRRLEIYAAHQVNPSFSYLTYTTYFQNKQL